MKKGIFLCLLILIFSLKTNAQHETCCQSPTAAQLMIEKGLSKIVQPNIRKNIIVDRETTTEGYNSNCSIKSKQLQTPIEEICEPRSHKTSRKSANLKLELKGLDIDNLYKALSSKHDFYIDPAEDTMTIDGKTCIIVKFHPKQNLVTRGMADQFINRVSGYICINLDNLSIVRIRGLIEKPFRFTYRVLGIIPIGVDVYSFEFLVEYDEFDGMMVEKTVNGSADYQIRNRGTEKYTNKISNYTKKN